MAAAAGKTGRKVAQEQQESTPDPAREWQPGSSKKEDKEQQERMAGAAGKKRRSSRNEAREQ